MQNLNIEATDYAPQVVFETNGTLLLKGRSLFIDTSIFYKPLIDWVSLLYAETVTLTIDLDYFDSSSLKKIFEILKVLDINRNVGKVDVVWKFEKDDDSILEKGQIFKERLKRTTFHYQEQAESK